MNDKPIANRPHIGFFGKCNSGKSSLINAFTGQIVSIVSDVPGTTTDPVYKAMELNGIGALVLVDTAGFDDISSLGRIRVENTKKASERIDVAVILFSDEDMSQEFNWVSHFKKHGTPVIPVISKGDINPLTKRIASCIYNELDIQAIVVSSVTGEGIQQMREQIIEALSEVQIKTSILGNLVTEGETVMLVMPQDIQAPTGRLILPQVQTLRELLDRKCITICVTTDNLEKALKTIKEPPSLIITDSQAFGAVYEQKPSTSKLTSFSILFAAYKGDLAYYIESVRQVNMLTENSRILIAECCTHAPLEEDIGRVKIPRMLRKKVGEGIGIDIVSGADLPDKLTDYDLIIQCGGCMYNRKYIVNRIDKAKAQGVPMTNYGILLACLTGILDKISY